MTVPDIGASSGGGYFRHNFVDFASDTGERAPTSRKRQHDEIGEDRDGDARGIDGAHGARSAHCRGGDIGEEPSSGHASKRQRSEDSAKTEFSILVMLIMLVQALERKLKKGEADDNGGDDGNIDAGADHKGATNFAAYQPPDVAPPVADDEQQSPVVSKAAKRSAPAMDIPAAPPVESVKASAPPPAADTGSVAAAGAKPFDPATQVNARDFGVDPGKADNQAELTAAIQGAKAQGKELYIGPGTYNHSGVLDVGGGKITGAGNSTVLHATDPDNAALKISADGGAISNLKTTVNADHRSSQPDASAILVQNASNASVSNVTAQGAAANGIRLDRANNATISHNLVTGTNADGIALMNGSTNNKVRANVIDQAADDACSSDSYNGDAIQNSHNGFEGNLIQNSRYGRALVSMGGKDDILKGNHVNNKPDHSPILAGTDANSGTMTGSGGVIEDNHVNTGDAPSAATILGWAPGEIADPSSYSNYVPGTGPGANNTPGNRG